MATSATDKKATKKTGKGGSKTLFKAPPPHPQHRGQPVRVGAYTVLAGGTRDLHPNDLAKADVLVPLTDTGIPYAFGRRYEVLAAPLQDYGGVPENWRQFLEGVIIPELESGRKLLAFCVGSHGRTGTFLASLIAILESPEETPDPIAAVRARHCSRAVETKAQARAIFALRGQRLPRRYMREFTFHGWSFATGTSAAKTTGKKASGTSSSKGSKPPLQVGDTVEAALEELDDRRAMAAE
jgi:hypothetical protein